VADGCGPEDKGIPAGPDGPASSSVSCSATVALKARGPHVSPSAAQGRRLKPPTQKCRGSGSASRDPRFSIWIRAY